MSDKEESSGSNNRWWESYLVRYFLGFVIGSICVAVVAIYAGLIPGSAALVDKTQRAVENQTKYGVTSIIITIALLGLAYCYIASTPITVLHAGRYRRGAADRLSRFFWFGWVLALLFSMALPEYATAKIPDLAFLVTVVLVVSAIAAFTLAPCAMAWQHRRTETSPAADDATDGSLASTNSARDTNDTRASDASVGSHRDARIKHTGKEFGAHEYAYIIAFFALIIWCARIIPTCFDVRPEIVNIRLLVIGAPVIWIGLMQYFVLFRILRTAPENYSFYKKLFAARRQVGARDVRDTYSHLREHSNAIFIVAVEISMLALMLGGIRIKNAATAVPGAPLEGITFWLCALGVWIVPTIFMWSRANAMERHFSDHPDDFIPTKKNHIYR